MQITVPLQFAADLKKTLIDHSDGLEFLYQTSLRKIRAQAQMFKKAIITFQELC